MMHQSVQRKPPDQKSISLKLMASGDGDNNKTDALSLA